MAKVPKIIRNEADLAALEAALNDPDERVRFEAAKRWFEIAEPIIDPSRQMLKFFVPEALAVLEKCLDTPNSEESLEAARWILKSDAEGLRLLGSEPELGIQRAREIVRDWKIKREDEEKSHPVN
jgi:hypothetical protein